MLGQEGGREKADQSVDSVTEFCRLPACCSNDIWTTGNHKMHSGVFKSIIVAAAD